MKLYAICTTIELKVGHLKCNMCDNTIHNLLWKIQQYNNAMYYTRYNIFIVQHKHRYNLKHHHTIYKKIQSNAKILMKWLRRWKLLKQFCIIQHQIPCLMELLSRADVCVLKKYEKPAFQKYSRNYLLRNVQLSP